ncbi:MULTISPECIES: ComEC/Rec2 family competence protein [unclassified Sphingomonas]|uniref:ComEC/Rec2 family competence protein n=1 Tax=unclassified Sphingomonas TaxID=196159 RepID=UPI001F2144F6|nr:MULTISPECIES: ComEC/Rec2 family competence protein [unclassified Sphingomonas]
MAPRLLQTTHVGAGFLAALERFAEAERGQLPLWMPVALGSGIAAWFVLPGPAAWAAVLLAGLAVALAGLVVPWGTRTARAITIGGLLVMLGCGLIWWRAERVAAPVLARPVVTAFEARVERVEPLPARELVRLTLAPISLASLPGREGLGVGRVPPGAASRSLAGQPTPSPSFPDRGGLPPRIRVNIAQADLPSGITPGATIALRARLMPPPTAALPGAYDFARTAWFQGIGATGRGFAPIRVVAPGDPGNAALRSTLTGHIVARVDGSEGGIAAAFVTGDRGSIAEADAEAMRRSGLAHLLSISGLHVTAVVVGTMTLVLKLLALFPPIALRCRLPVVAAGAGAMTALAYTWLSGADVPTVRSCIAALLVLAALSLGREAITLRLIATGALLVLLVLPESLAGPSFQLSFAAVTAIVALHEHPRVHRWFLQRDEAVWRRFARSLGSLLLTGLLVEAALMPIGLYHFHKAGLYGALANIVAIPLTTFVTMPLEALALLLDLGGLGAPAWWVVERSLALLLWIARTVAAAPGSVAALPAMPDGAFALMVAGGLWIALWRTAIRRWGLVPLAIGGLWALATPAPDLLVTGDGRHLALATPAGGMAILRDRAGDYVRSTLGEGGGVEGTLPPLSEQPGVKCSADLCIATRQAGDRRWTIVATRSGYAVPWAELVAACRRADIVVSDRRLPAACTPRWLKLDRTTLAGTGGVAISLADARVTTVRGGGRHPWEVPQTIAPPRPPYRERRNGRKGGVSDALR